MKKKDCVCERCKNACKYKPGWFKPSQIKAVMEHFDAKTIRDLLGRDKFAIDWWNGVEKDILVLAPNIKGNYGIQYPKNPRGECVFFKNERCAIHDIKPFECAVYHHDDTDKTVKKRHEGVSRIWSKSDILFDFEDEIECESFSIFDSLGLGIFD